MPGANDYALKSPPESRPLVDYERIRQIVREEVATALSIDVDEALEIESNDETY